MEGHHETDAEAAKVKRLLGVTSPPLPVIGQQRLVSERVVTHPTNGTTAAITTHEQVVEQRVQTGVIRRRTTRVAVPQEMAAVGSPIFPVEDSTYSGLMRWYVQSAGTLRCPERAVGRDGRG